MKKIAITLLALLPALWGWSQDTVHSPLKDNYYITLKPNLDGYWQFGSVVQSGDRCGIETKEMSSNDTITIYGLAASMMTEYDAAFYLEGGILTEEEWWADFWSQFQDTTNEECYEYLGIYFAFGDSLVPQREVLVHREYDTVAYYVETGRDIGVWIDCTYPMYEKYFDSSIAVRGTFYVGTTQRSLQDPYGVPVLDHMGFRLKCLVNTGLGEYHVSKYCYPKAGQEFWYWPPRQSQSGDYYLIFPILTPEPEPTGDTTMAAGEADLVSRYVSVQPNPAVGEAKVLSSFGLERIEAYDAAGQRVADLPASGLQATLNVAPWPRGTYLLRILTPAGATTKKLIVQ